VTAVFLIAQVFWVCEPQPVWKEETAPQCRLTKQVVICQIVSDVLSDLVLILAPLGLVRNLQDIALKRRLTVIFSTSIITTIVSLVHAVLITQDGANPKITIAALVENTVSLIVCNLSVLAAAGFRLRYANGIFEEPKHPSLRIKTQRSNHSSQRSPVINITATIALDEVRDSDQFKRDSVKSSFSNSGKTSKASTIPDAPPPVHLFGRGEYPYGSWEDGPDSGKPFGSYFKDHGHF